MSGERPPREQAASGYWERLVAAHNNDMERREERRHGLGADPKPCPNPECRFVGSPGAPILGCFEVWDLKRGLALRCPACRMRGPWTPLLAKHSESFAEATRLWNLLSPPVPIPPGTPSITVPPTWTKREIPLNPPSPLGVAREALGHAIRTSHDGMPTISQGWCNVALEALASIERNTETGETHNQQKTK